MRSYRHGGADKRRLGRTALVCAACWVVLISSAVARHNAGLRDMRAISTYRFVHVRSNCTPENFTLFLETAEPFRGAVYARGYPQSPCYAAGEGSSVTWLALEPQTCGVQVVESKSTGHTMYEVQVYVQYDRWVQQAIDEQVHVRCKLQEPAEEHAHAQNWKKGVAKYETKEGLKLLKKSSTETEPLSKSSLPEKPKFVFQDFNNSVIIQTNTEDGNSVEGRNSNSSKEVFDFEKLANITKDLSVREVIVQSHEDAHKFIPNAVVSEIKISSSPNSEESEAMVASTLLTVSSRVRDRLMKGKAGSRNRGGLAEEESGGENDIDIHENTLNVENVNNSLSKTNEEEHKQEEKESDSGREKEGSSEINSVWNASDQVTAKEESNKILMHILARTNSGAKSSSNISDDGISKGNRTEKSNNEIEVSSNVINEWKPDSDFLDLNSWHVVSGVEEEPVSVWLDILRGNGTNGKPASDGLAVGEDATLVVSARTAPGLTTLVTECRAHDGADGARQDLSDSRGCAIDPAIMPGLRKKDGKEPGVKIEYAPFRAFKFPDRTSLHLKCTVLICLGECPQSNCNVVTRRPGASSPRNGRRGRKMVELVGVGEFEPSDVLMKEAFGVQQPRGGLALSVGLELDESNLPESNNHIPNAKNKGKKEGENDITKNATTPQSKTSTTIPSAPLSLQPTSTDLATLLKSSNLNGGKQLSNSFGMIVDRIEVFNSVEVTAPGVENEPRDLVKQYRLQDGSARSQEELLGGDMFCIASQKLAVAFGLLVAVMACALIFALYTCVRHRLFHFSRSPHETGAVRRYDSSPSPHPASSTLGFPGLPKPLPPLSSAAVIAPRNYYRCHR